MQPSAGGAFEFVLVWRFDRFARSVTQLVLALEESRSLNIGFISHQEALDTSSPMGEAMFAIIAAMAQLERRVIQDRILAGLEHARVRGTKSGAPIGRPKVVFDRARLVVLRNAGASWRMIAGALEISTGTARAAFHAGVQKPLQRETADGVARQRSAGRS
ncbi:MAG TPA: recombinase family protein [Terriglobales bacterium]